MNSFERLDDSTLMPFGKHEGERLDEVPASYLLWFEKEALKRSVRRKFTNGLIIYIEENRFLLEQLAKKESKKYFRKVNKYR